MRARSSDLQVPTKRARLSKETSSVGSLDLAPIDNGKVPGPDAAARIGLSCASVDVECNYASVSAKLEAEDARMEYEGYGNSPANNLQISSSAKMGESENLAADNTWSEMEDRIAAFLDSENVFVMSCDDRKALSTSTSIKSIFSQRLKLQGTHAAASDAKAESSTLAFGRSSLMERRAKMNRSKLNAAVMPLTLKIE